MLRWIAVLAVVINVIYFAVRYSSTPENVISQNGVSGNPGVAQLVMLDEHRSMSADNGKDIPASADKIPKENNGGKVLPVTELQEVVSSQESVADKSVADGEEQGESSESSLVEEVAPPLFNTCWDIGKFSTEASAKQLQERLVALGEVLTIQKRSVAGEPDYWVFLGPYDSRRQALAAHRDMQARKIDSFLIAEGELENAVSLGLFSREAGAQKMLQERKKQGLDAKMRAVPRMRNEWWATINYAKGPLPDSIREIILSVQDDPALEIKSLVCESIANTKKLD
jgi:hypothetical protein